MSGYGQGQHPPLDFRLEEETAYETFNRAAAAVYKFFDMFRVELSDDKSSQHATATVHFGKSYEDDEVSLPIAKQVRAYVKEQKRAIRENPMGYDAAEGRRKVFWLLTMMQEHGIFSPSHQGKIMTYAQYVFHETKEEE
jgi:hypothetical protein